MTPITDSLPRVLHSTTRVRFQDADPFNHLNNSKYIDYFINAREDQVEAAYGLDFRKIAVEQQLGWIVAQQQIAYLRPALTGEVLYLDSQLTHYSANHLSVEIRMWDRDQKVLKSFIWIQFMPVHIKAQRVQPHSDDLMALFEAVQLPLDETVFEERSRYWRAYNKRQRQEATV